MCTNSRLVNTLECYMDELVDCFEDFVTKSLVIISLAIGALIVMIGYVLKVLTDRNLIQLPPPRRPGSISIGPDPGRLRGRTEATTLNYAPSTPSAIDDSEISTTTAHLQNLKNENIRKSRSNTLPKPTKDVNMSYVKTTSTASNTGPWLGASVPSFDERVLRNIGLSSCSENCSKRSLKRNSSTSRVLYRSMPSCIPNHHLSTPRPCSRNVQPKGSCCSMCCADDDRR